MAYQIITDLPVIAKRSEAVDDDNWRFRRFLKGCDSERLDRTVHRITDDVWSQIDCTKCANCCKVLETVVTEEDCARLAKRLGMTAEEFEREYVREELSDDGERMLKSMPCVFLGDDNRCTVYEDRPECCRDYPFLYKDDFTFRTVGMISRLDNCPIVFNVWELLKLHFRWRSRTYR